jgi:hypothetical protein
MVPLAAIGIVKDKPLPDERMKKIMTEVADGSTMLWFAATSPQVWRSATGSRPFPAKAGSHCCGCTAPLEPFFTKECRPSKIESVR